MFSWYFKQAILAIHQSFYVILEKTTKQFIEFTQILQNVSNVFFITLKIVLMDIKIILLTEFQSWYCIEESEILYKYVWFKIEIIEKNYIEK